MHGYEMIRELRDRTGGTWQPSPGSIYPTLQLLEDEGLVTVTERDGKKVYALTDAGRAEVESRGQGAPWEDLTEPADSPWAELRSAGISLMTTAMSAAPAANEAQLRRIAQALRETRARILRILSEEE
jgi:DNA-binding PadR family transcriptional regulator